MVSTAFSFGTIGSRAEHEHITRDALGCAPGTTSLGDCFEPDSIRQLAGSLGFVGAVGSPDFGLDVFTPGAHCDDPDYLDLAKHGMSGTYPRSRAKATQALLDCNAHLSGRFSEGLDASTGILDTKNNILKAETDLNLLSGGDCRFATSDSRAKCDASEGFGRALHGVQDFYSHSNWVDDAVPGTTNYSNPPGLHLPAPSFILDLRSAMTPVYFPVPDDLTTGCYLLGVDGKDGAKRGKIGNNFELAVDGAIIETRRQWRDFRAELVSRHGSKKASLIVCALTRDQPWRHCTGSKVALVIDSSDSNTETDPSGLRVTAAKELAATLVTEAMVGPDNFPDLVTVISFTTAAEVLYPLGDPTSATFDGVCACGGTYIAGGVALAIDELTKDNKDLTEDHSGIVVFTDGLDSNPSDLWSELDRAAQLGIRVSFAFLDPIPNPVPRRTMKRSKQERSLPQSLRTRQIANSSTLTADGLLPGVLTTGGVFGFISSAEAQKAFVQLVIARGTTNINSIGQSYGGPLFPGIDVYSLLPSVAETDVFTYHALPGLRLTFEISVVSSPKLNITLHDVKTSEDVTNVATNSQGIATIMYEASSETDLELVVGLGILAPPRDWIYTVNLNVTQTSGGSPDDHCNIAAKSSCPTLGEIKCCSSGLTFREPSPG